MYHTNFVIYLSARIKLYSDMQKNRNYNIDAPTALCPSLAVRETTKTVIPRISLNSRFSGVVCASCRLLGWLLPKNGLRYGALSRVKVVGNGAR